MSNTRLYPLAILLALAGCGGSSVKETLGLNRTAPDEYRVVSRPPLSVPPQFSLRPPGTEESPDVVPASKQAESVMTGHGASSDDSNIFTLQPADTAVAPVIATPLSNKANTADAQFLKNAGADNADPKVRTQMAEEHIIKQQEAPEKSWWDVFSSTPEKKEPVVNAKGEAARIGQNKTAGKPVTAGDTPEVKAQDTGVLGRIFGY